MRSSRGGWPGWRQLRFPLGLLLLIGGLLITYLWRLGSLTPGLSSAEAAARDSSNQLHSLTTQPLYAPHRLIQLAFQSAHHSGAFWLRLPSVLFAIFLIGCFYYVARMWFGRLIATLGTLLFAFTPWVVLLSRNASPYILLLAPLAVVAVYIHFNRLEKSSKWAWWGLILTIGASLYVPGMPWVLILGSLFAWRRLGHVSRTLPVVVIAGGVILGLVLISPLVWSFIHDWRLIKPWLLIPADWPGTLDILKSVGWAALALVWHARQHMDLLIGRLAILSIAQVSLLAIGFWAMWRRARLELYELVGLAIFGVVAAGINQDIKYLTLSLPALGLIMAAGLRYLYIEWRQVFPRNPLPRTLALVLMVVLIGTHVIFGIRYSLMAWPHTLDTRHNYVLK